VLQSRIGNDDDNSVYLFKLVIQNTSKSCRKNTIKLCKEILKERRQQTRKIEQCQEGRGTKSIFNKLIRNRA
jgi:ribosome recycling factor